MGVAAQVTGNGAHGAAVLTDELAVTGGDEEEDVTLVVEPAEAVVDEIARAEIVGEQVVAGEECGAGGACGSQVGGQVIARPRIETVVGEDGRAAGWTALMHVDVVGARKLRRGQLSPQGAVVLRQPPAQDFLVTRRRQGFVLQGLPCPGAGAAAAEGPAARPPSAGVGAGFTQLVEAAYGDGGQGVRSTRDSDRVVASRGRRAQVEHPRLIAP